MLHPLLGHPDEHTHAEHYRAEDDHPSPHADQERCPYGGKCGTKHDQNEGNHGPDACVAFRDFFRRQDAGFIVA